MSSSQFNLEWVSCSGVFPDGLPAPQNKNPRMSVEHIERFPHDSVRNRSFFFLVLNVLNYSVSGFFHTFLGEIFCAKKWFGCFSPDMRI